MAKIGTFDAGNFGKMHMHINVVNYSKKLMFLMIKLLN